MEKYSFGKSDEKKLMDNFAKALKDEEFVKVVNGLEVDEILKKLEISKEWQQRLYMEIQTQEIS